MDAIATRARRDIQMTDSTSARAHQQAATAKRGGDHCLGRSRGGLTTKIHVVVDAQGLPIRLGLTADQTHDGQIVGTLLDAEGSTQRQTFNCGNAKFLERLDTQMAVEKKIASGVL